MPAGSAFHARQDRPKPVAEGLWVVESGHRVASIPLPVRMTVIRLSGGGLMLHSPTRYTPQLHEELKRLGRIEHLVAPNSAHWSYLRSWQEHVPEALVWAAPGLRRRRQVRRSGLRIDRDLGDAPPPDWREDMDQTVVPGAAGFREVAFLHRTSRTLILTDLIVNVRPRDLPPLARLGAKIVGSTAPDGRAPAYLRAVVRLGGRPAREAAERLVAWQPQRVVFAHGDWYESNGEARLRRALDWLLPAEPQS